jgi:hypothetical protein
MAYNFDAIGEATSLRLVAQEWRELEASSDQLRRDGGADDSDDFQANLRRILFCSRVLQRENSPKNALAFSQSVEHQLTGKPAVLGEAISDVVSVESNLDRLLAARDELAVEILEALQMVRPPALLVLSR